MRQSKLFTKTLKEAPSDEEAKNAKLLIRAGYIHKEMAGVYQLLPLGLRVVEKIKQIVREEMDAVGTQEMIATNLQRKALWDKTGRWDDDVVDVWFKSELKAGGEVGLAWSHEEPLANMMKSHISSYKDLPVFIYQFQNKLRNELRAKSGMMRGREFVMKDAYSFCRNEDDHTAYYEGSKVAYMKCFQRMGVGEDTFVTFAAGGAFTEFSHEFQTICEAGEDVS
ncbi:MAG: prolyl-tRNA synthetase, partial [Acidimicrobiales bacterium]